MKTAILITCHNRKEQTKKCLNSLLSSQLNNDVFLVDDGSIDGTTDMIRNEYPHIHLIQGDGSLYWSKGMYTAWKEALKNDYDHYLWLNDDIELYPSFYKELIECKKIISHSCIVSGLVEDVETKKIIYGGYNQKKEIILPNDTPQEIRYMNGNVVLVPKEVVKEIGIIDPTYHHDLGDLDYGLTAIKRGIKVVSTRIPIAKGKENNVCRVRKWGTNIIKRFEILYSPLGSPPYLNFYYRKKHFGIINACTYYLYLHIINILPDKCISEKYKN